MQYLTGLMRSVSLTVATIKPRNRNAKYSEQRANSPQLLKKQTMNRNTVTDAIRMIFWSIIFDSGLKENVSYFHLKICKTPSLLRANPDCQALHHLTITIKPETGSRNANLFRMTEW
jgi:hypothetical protein